MKIKKVIKIVDGNTKNVNGSFNKIKLDSRSLEKNDLFVAINDGYKYIDEALKKDCKVIGNIKRDDIIVVNDSIEALGKIAKYKREHFDKPVIAITGSNGKTTTKDLICDVLSKKYNVLKNEKNKNNNIGLPETLLQLNEKYDMCVVELGMNHPNEIDYLADICKPDYSIITNIGSAHIGNLKTKKNIFKAKLEIKNHSKNMLVNGDDKYLKKVKDSKKVSLKELKNISYYIDRTEFDFNDTHFIFNIPGKHLLIDVLFAIKIGLIYDVDIEDIKASIYKYKTINGRMNIIKGKYTIFDDCYNANYESLRGSLEIIKKDKRFKIIILSDMLELGKKSKHYHKKVNSILRKIKNKEVLLIGNYTRYINGKHFNNNDELYDYLITIVGENDLIYIKGSNAFNLKMIVDKMKNLE